MKKPPARRVSVVEHGPRRLDTKWSTETQTARDPDGKTAGPRRQDRRTQTARHAVEHRNRRTQTARQQDADGKTAGRRHVFEPARRLVEHGHNCKARASGGIIPREGGEHRRPLLTRRGSGDVCSQQGSGNIAPRPSFPARAGNMGPAPLNRRGTRRVGDRDRRFVFPAALMRGTSSPRL